MIAASVALAERESFMLPSSIGAATPELDRAQPKSTITTIHVTH
jgi:hypothetical protein